MKMSLQRRMTLIVLCTSLAALLVMSAVSLYAMFGLRSIAVNSGENISRHAFEGSSSIMADREKTVLSHLAMDWANQINFTLLTVAEDTEVIAGIATDVLCRPERYGSPSLSSEKHGGGKINTYLRYPSADFDREKYRAQLLQLSWLQDINTRFIKGNNKIHSIAVASLDGYSIITKDHRNVSDEKYAAPPEFFNPLTRDWFKAAVDTGGTVFTDIDTNSYDSNNWSFHFSTPYRDAAGEIAGVVSMEWYLADLRDSLKSIDLRRTGSCFILDQKGRLILFSGDHADASAFPIDMTDLRISSNPEIAQAAAAMVNGESAVTEISIHDEPHFIAYAPIQLTGWSFGIAIESAEVLAPVDENYAALHSMAEDTITEIRGYTREIILAILFFILILIAAVTFAGKKLSDHFTQPIRLLRDGVKEVSGGNLEKKLDIRTGDELEELADSFNVMTDDLTSYMKNLAVVTADRERIETELNVAATIQSSMLPSVFPAFPDRKEFDIYATMHPAKEVGGDFYDFFLIDEDHLAIVIADVSGKGVAAALFMVIAKTLIKSRAQSGKDLSPEKILRDVNEKLCEGNDANMFVTVWLGILEISTGRGWAANAGHEHPGLRRAGGSYELIRYRHSTVVALMDGLTFEEHEFKLHPGDSLFVYTDGVPEASDSDTVQFGLDRLTDALNEVPDAAPRELLEHVKARIDTFIGDAPQFDDITMVGFTYFGPEAQEESDPASRNP